MKARKITDKERLDWLTEHADWCWDGGGNSQPSFSYSKDDAAKPMSFREWVDAAIRAERRQRQVKNGGKPFPVEKS